MQQWFGYSDQAMEHALQDVPLLRRFAELDVFEDVMPDDSTILRFRHLLEKHDLAVAIFAEVSAALSEKCISMKHGMVVDATLITAPSSTKNEDKQRDQEVKQTKKGNQWHFGMKAHIGVDADSCLIYTTECRMVKVADIMIMESCLRDEETLVLGDRGYHKKNRTIDEFEKVGNFSILTPTKKPAGGVLTDEQKALNWMLSAVRAIIEHLFRVVKRQFVFVKVCYHELAKNTGKIVTLFALVNMWLVHKRLFPLMGEVRP